MNKFTGTLKLIKGNRVIQSMNYKFLYERHRLIEEWKSAFMWPGMFIQICPDVYDEPESGEVIGKIRKKKADPEIQSKYVTPPYKITKPAIRYTGYK